MGGPPGKDNRIWFQVQGERLVAWDVAKIPWDRPRFRDGRILQESGDGTYGILDPKTNQYQRGKFTYQAAGKDDLHAGRRPRSLHLWLRRDADGYLQVRSQVRPGQVGGHNRWRRGLLHARLRREALQLLLFAAGCHRLRPHEALEVRPLRREQSARSVVRSATATAGRKARVIGPDDLFYIVSHAPYGQLGGAMAIFDPQSQKVVANFRNLVPNQSLICVAWEKQSNLIFGGSDVWGGGGSEPTEKEARLFAFDPVKREKLYEVTPLPGESGIKVLAAAEGKVFGVGSRSNKTFVFDPQTKTVTRTFGQSVRVAGLGLVSRGQGRPDLGPDHQRHLHARSQDVRVPPGNPLAKAHHRRPGA